MLYDFDGSVYSENELLARLESARRSGRVAEEANVLHSLGIKMSYSSESKAIAYYKEALQLYNRLGNMAGVALTCFHMASVYRGEFGDLERALYYYEHALAVAPDPFAFRSAQKEIDWIKEALGRT